MDALDDAFRQEMRERLTRIETQLTERCAYSLERIGAVEKSQIRYGERIGKLEAQEQQRKGGMVAVAALASAVSVLVTKFWPFEGQ